MNAGAEFFAKGPVDSASNGGKPTPESSAGEAVPVHEEIDAGQVNREEWPVSAEAISLDAEEQSAADTGMDTGTDTGFVRPYAITGGRTRANHTLEMETLVSTSSDDSIAEPEQVEQRSIMSECRNPRSVAEIASLLGMPVGVARVLISDAADAGLVTVHKTISSDEGAEEHLLLMERVLSGLRRL